MVHLFINALAASAGGGLTYIRNVVPHLAKRDDVHATVVLTPSLRAELEAAPNLTLIEHEDGGGLRRAWFEQHTLPRWIAERKAGVLLSAGNFAIRRPGVPQILLSRNSLYTSSDFFDDLQRRGERRLWLETHVKGMAARWSIRTADRTVAPSESFAADLRKWTGKPVVCIHHGFDAAAFVRDDSPLPDAIQAQLNVARDSLKLLFVSHYNYYRNFETLIRALPLIQRALAPRRVQLFLTCRLRAGANPGAYDPATAAALVRDLALTGDIVELEAVPYPQLHHVYRAADIYVTPAYAETFAHPLVEAMFSGLPIVASDIPVHREIADVAGRYFSRFSHHQLAEEVTRVAQSREIAGVLSSQGKERAGVFSWQRHVEKIVALANEMAGQAVEGK